MDVSAQGPLVLDAADLPAPEDSPRPAWLLAVLDEVAAVGAVIKLVVAAVWALTDRHVLLALAAAAARAHRAFSPLPDPGPPGHVVATRPAPPRGPDAALSLVASASGSGAHGTSPGRLLTA